MNAEQCARIWQMALLLGAEKVTDEQGAMLAELAGDSACAFCNRTDIPREMEQAVAMLLLELQEARQPEALCLVPEHWWALLLERQVAL